MVKSMRLPRHFAARNDDYHLVVILSVAKNLGLGNTDP
jgi:hypothetical protein